MPDRLPVRVFQARHKAARKRLDQWIPTWRDVYRYMLPMRDVIDSPMEGEEKGLEVYDSTGLGDLAHFANRITSELFPSGQEWVIGKSGPKIPEDQKKAVNEKLQQDTEIFHAAIQSSNFDVAVNEFMHEFAVGTGNMLFLEGPDYNPFVFHAVPSPLVALEHGPRGGVGGRFRDIKMAVELIQQEWPDAVLPADLKQRMETDPHEEVNIVEYTYPKTAPGDDAWCYDLFLPDGEQFLLKEPRLYDMAPPWITARYMTAPGEVYGRGPALYALPDVRTLNKLTELILMNLSLSVAGVYTGVDDGVLNPATAVIEPASIIPVARNNGHPMGASLMPLERSGDFNLAFLEKEDLQAQIHRLLFNKNLPPETGPVRSATEIIERIKEVSIDIGAAFGRIMSELMEPLYFRGMQILHNKGLVNFPFRIDGAFIKVQAVGPLAHQQELDDLQRVIEWIELLNMFGPDVAFSSAKIEVIGQWIGRKLGVDETLIRQEGEQDDEITGMDVREMLQSYAAQMVQQQGQQQAPPAAGM